MKYALVNTTTNIVDNVIELDEGNYTTTFMLDDANNQVPTFLNAQGVLTISRTRYLVPSTYTIELSDAANPGDPWPLPTPAPTDEE